MNVHENERKFSCMECDKTLKHKNFLLLQLAELVLLSDVSSTGNAV